MFVHKAILRIDYPTNFEMMDRMGSLARVVTNESQFTWTNVGEKQPSKAITASLKEDQFAVEFESSPNNSYFMLESGAGYSYKNLLTSEMVLKLTRLLDRIVKEFEITSLSRSGFRTWAFGTKPFGLEKSLALIQGVADAVNTGVGEISDIGLVLEGERADDISYRICAGPCINMTKEVPNHFKLIQVEDFSEDLAPTFIFDCDLVEKSFDLSTYNSVAQWVKPLAKVAEVAFDGVSNNW